MAWGVTTMAIQTITLEATCRTNWKRARLGETAKFRGPWQQCQLSPVGSEPRYWGWGQAKVGELYRHGERRMGELQVRRLRVQALDLNPDPAVSVLHDLKQVSGLSYAAVFSSTY